MKVTDIERCVKILAQHAIKAGIEEITFPDDHYWTVESPTWTKVYNQPKLGIGSFADDANELERLLSEPDRASAVDLDRVAYMLRRLSDQLAF